MIKIPEKLKIFHKYTQSKNQYHVRIIDNHYTILKND